jgi:hypothetical protein
MSKHEFQTPKVTEIVSIRKSLEHDDFIEGLSIPAKLAEVFDLNQNVIEVDFGKDKAA